jgi:hypothetical protein
MATGMRAPDALLVPLLEGARRRAAQGFGLQSLLRAYRIGIRVMWSEITASSVWRGRPLHGALAQVGTWTLGFADQIFTGVEAAYMEEAARVAREREHRRSALLNVILAGPGSERLDGPEELNRPHCVVVARVAPDLPLQELEATGMALEERARALLWTVRHRSVVAAVGLPDAWARRRLAEQLTRLVAEGRIVAFGLGGRAEAVSETRASYAEAVEALRIGPCLDGSAKTVHDHQDFAPLAALLVEPGRARRFAEEELQPLGDLLRREWVLPTIEEHLVHQGRLKEVAAALNVHPSTVKYRLKELRPFLGDALCDGERASRLLLAVRIRRLQAAELSTDRLSGQRPGPPSCRGSPATSLHSLAAPIHRGAKSPAESQL